MTLLRCKWKDSKQSSDLKHVLVPSLCTAFCLTYKMPSTCDLIFNVNTQRLLNMNQSCCFPRVFFFCHDTYFPCGEVLPNESPMTGKVKLRAKKGNAAAWTLDGLWTCWRSEVHSHTISLKFWCASYDATKIQVRCAWLKGKDKKNLESWS